MGDKVLLRPDGSRLVVPAEKTAPLLALGYKEEGFDEAAQRHHNEGMERVYSSTAEQLKTGAEGLASGLTLGLSDIALEGMGAATAERAKHNPGIRIGAELVGGMLPMAPGGVGKFFTLTPAGAVTKAAGAAGGKFTGAGRGAVAGVIEGAGAGLQQEVSHTTLNGEPLTVEGALAGMGWGAVFGGGIGAFAGAGQAKLEARAERKATEASTNLKKVKDDAWAQAATSEKWGNMRNTFREIGSQADEAIKLARTHMETSTSIYGEAQTAAAVKHAQSLAGNVEGMSGALADAKGYLNSIVKEGQMGAKGVKQAHNAAVKAHDKLKKALKAKNFEGIDELTADFRTKIDELHSVVPGKVEAGDILSPEVGMQSHKTPKPQVPDYAPGNPAIAEAQAIVDPEIALKAEAAGKAYEELASIGLTGDQLKRIPATPEAFSRMGVDKMERMQASIEKFLSTKTPEFAGLQESLARSIEEMAIHTGVTIEGDVGAQFRGIWETMKSSGKKSVQEGVEEMLSKGQTPWATRQAKQAVGRGASQYASNQYGAGPFMQSTAYQMGSALVGGIISLKAGVLGAISSRALAWAPAALKAVQVVGPRAEPFMTRLDGLQDEKMSRAELFKKRQAEITGAAGGVRDTLYKSIAPLTIEHPEFAAATFNHAVKQFQFLLNKMPKDPGHAFSRLKSLWKPDQVQMEKFSRYYEVFQNPVAVITRSLDTLSITPEAAEGIREMYPALFVHMRVEMLDRISDPAIMEKLSYNEQVRLGTLLDLKLHSSMSPRFIASQQQMFQQRQQLTPMPPQPGAPGGLGGRPSGSGPANSPFSSAGQKVTAH